MKHPLQVLHEIFCSKKEVPFCIFTGEEKLGGRYLWIFSVNLAKDLIKFGIKPGDRVIICGKNSRRLIIAIFACWFCGVIVLPVNEKAGPDKRETIKKRFKADYLIDINENAVIGNDSGESAVINFTNKDYDRAIAESLLKNINPDKGALCLYTSGSTGEPKGVLLSLNSLAYGANNVIEAFEISSKDLAFCVLPLTHINGLVTTLLAPLYSGSRVLFYQNNFFEDIQDALLCLEKYQCTWMSAIPVHYAMMCKNAKYQSNGLKLRFCRSAAAPLPVKVLEAFEKSYGIPLIETLGMTETAGQIFANPLPPGAHKPGSVGRSVNFQALIIDNDGNETAGSQTGEIAVKGNAMMLEYLDDQEATEDAFINGWLKTGDLGRIDNDGYYYIEGRKKHMIIFAGENVPLGLIERMISDLPEVNAAACTPDEHRLFGEVFNLFIELSTDESQILQDNNSLTKKVKSIISSQLPAPQAVNKIKIVKEIPKTAVGKVDRSRLNEL